MPPKQNNKDADSDLCVFCGKETEYKKSNRIESRQGYIEGSGQLCGSCSVKLNNSQT